MAIFYAPNIIQNPILSEEESLHCSRVLRLQVGEIISIIDGKGGSFRARITAAHPKHTMVEILSETYYDPKDYGIHIAIAPTKNIDRFEWFLEKSTEIGITEITPLFCEHSERKQVNLDRMKKILVAAIKQSKNVYLPQLHSMCTFGDFVSKVIADRRYIAHCYDEKKRLLFCEPLKQKKTVVLIGPEGDFSEYEIKLALEQNFVPISLGDNRLRTETAGVVACHLVNLAQVDRG